MFNFLLIWALIILQCNRGQGKTLLFSIGGCYDVELSGACERQKLGLMIT
jgi:hypothetical protein